MSATALPTMSVRARPEDQRLIRDIARALRERPELADKFTKLAAGDGIPPPEISAQEPPAVPPNLTPSGVVHGLKIFREFPKWIEAAGVSVNNEAEEAAALARAKSVASPSSPPKAPAPAPKNDWEKLGDAIEGNARQIREDAAAKELRDRLFIGGAH